MSRAICLDYDGTLHPYTKGWLGEVPDDEPPIVGAAEFLATLVADGYRIVVLSARAETIGGTQGIWDWLESHDLGRFVTEVTDRKVPAVAYMGRWVLPFDGDWAGLTPPPKSEAEKRLLSLYSGEAPLLSDADWGYVGALVDGEGCITGAHNGKGAAQVRVMVTNQHRFVLDWLAEEFGGTVHERKRVEGDGYRFPIFQWYRAGAGIGVLLEGCLRLGTIRMKKLQAELALEFVSNCRYNGRKGTPWVRMRQQQLLTAIQSLNQTGIARIEPILIDDRGVTFSGNWDEARVAIEALAAK